MDRSLVIVFLTLALIKSYECLQVQLQQTGDFIDDTENQGDLESQLSDLRKNVSEIWKSLDNMEKSLNQHLSHLRHHQTDLESAFHDFQYHPHGAGDSHGDDHHSTADYHSHSNEHHSHDTDNQHSHGSDDHHHSGEQHSHSDDHSSHSHSHSHTEFADTHHSGEQHSHGDSHSSQSHSHTHTTNELGNHHHSGDQGEYHHSGEHGENHHHSGEQGEHHHHSGEQGEHHHHSSEQGGHQSHSSEHGGHHHHSSEQGEHHHHSGEQGEHHHHSGEQGEHHSHGEGQNHKDSHTNEDLAQQVQQPVNPIVEPMVLPEERKEHYHHRYSKPSDKDSVLRRHYPHRHHSHSHYHSYAPTGNNTVSLPRTSDYLIHDFAVCIMHPNRAIPEDKQQNIEGRISLWQKKTGGALNIHVRLQGFKVGDNHEDHQQQVQENNEMPSVSHKHGFHIHTLGDLSNGCQSTGPHYNPRNATHGGSKDLNRHVGDLGNIECDENGKTNIVFMDEVSSLRGPYSIIGKSIVIHAETDDLGKGGNEESLKTGNSGIRIACCVIERANTLSLKTYKYIKLASQYQNH